MIPSEYSQNENNLNNASSSNSVFSFGALKTSFHEIALCAVHALLI